MPSPLCCVHNQAPNRFRFLHTAFPGICGNLRNQCDTLLRNPRRDAPFLHTAASRDIRANIFFFSCWIHSFCHFLRTAGCRDTADNCVTATPIGPPIAVPRAAPVTAPPAASTPVPTGCTSSSPVIGLAFFLDFSFIPSVAVSPYAEFADGRHRT